jgi:hypothetical protein
MAHGIYYHNDNNFSKGGEWKNDNKSSAGGPAWGLVHSMLICTIGTDLDETVSVHMYADTIDVK